MRGSDANAETVHGTRLVQTDASFLHAQLAMAETDQIGLVVDLRARTVQLVMKGVPLRTMSMHEEQSRTHLLIPFASDSSDTTPLFTLKKEAATIEKIPIRKVEAPKDTAEARLRPLAEAPSEIEDPEVILWFEQGVVVHLTTPDATWSLLALRSRLGAEITGIGERLNGQTTPPEQWVRLAMDAADVRAIYRALSSQAPLVLRMP